MSLPDYKKSYAVLGVFQDDDWGTIRNAYKRLIRKWHPDRFQETEQRDFAENKCKEINLSYQTLDNFYQEHGHLPLIEPVDQGSAPASPGPSRNCNPEPHPNTAAYADTWPAWNKPDLPGHTGRRRLRGLLTLIIVVAIGVWLTESVFTDQPEPDAAATAGNSSQLPATAGVVTDTVDPADPSSPAASGQQNHLLNEWGEQSLSTLSDTSSASTGARLSFIVIGSTKREVLTLLGRPTRETEHSWEYGLSQINFRHDRVSDWYENPMNPLRVRK